MVPLKRSLVICFSVFDRRNGNGCVRMQVIDMFKRQKSMQGRINRGSFGAQVKNTMVEKLYHLVFMLDATVDVF